MAKVDARLEAVFASPVPLPLDQFVATHCSGYGCGEGCISFGCNAGQDEFNIPGVHTRSSLATAVLPVQGAFTFYARCAVIGKCKFDAAGVYLKLQYGRVKCGVECYSEHDYHIVTVRTGPLSDESNGRQLGVSHVHLIMTRRDGVFSFYSLCDGTLRFERAFAVEGEPGQVAIGLYVQSPFSEDGAAGAFDELRLSHVPLDDIRL